MAVRVLPSGAIELPGRFEQIVLSAFIDDFAEADECHKSALLLGLVLK